MISPLHLYRAARACRKLGIPKVPSALWRLNLFLTGCDLPPTVTVGKRVQFQHFGAGVIVNGAVDIGDDVMIMPHVVIGQNVRGGKEVVEVERITIGNSVMLGAGAKIIASGRLAVGEGAAVGANAVVTRDVAPGDVVGGIPARTLKRQESDEAMRSRSAGM